MPIDDADSTAIAYMKRLPDGAQVVVSQKTITALFYGYLYIEEPDRSAGICIMTIPYYAPPDAARGNLVSLSGVMGTLAGERVIYARSELTVDETATARIASLGMAMPAIVGWPVDLKNPDGLRVQGQVPVGLLVRVFGTVTARDQTDEDGALYCYLDDGTHPYDGNLSNYHGLRVYSELSPQPGDNFLVAMGICCTKLYDPTPGDVPGDEFIMPVVRTSEYDELFSPTDYVAPAPQRARISGRVRLVGQAAPGARVRIYSAHSSIIIDNVTDQWTPYTLEGVSVDGDKVSASAPGYLSSTRDAAGGATDVDFALQPADHMMEISCDHSSIRICSSETSLISAMLRDSEGKGIAGHQVKFTTTMGLFTETGAREYITTTDAVGFAYAHLSAGADGAGGASVRAESYPDSACFTHREVTFNGPDISLSACNAHLAQPGSSIVKALLTDATVPMPNARIVFLTDFGVFQESGNSTFTTLTDANGNAQATLVLSSPGTAKVNASYENQCNQQTVGWIAVSFDTAPWINQPTWYSSPLVERLHEADDGKKDVALVTSSGDIAVYDSNGNQIWISSMHAASSNTPACAVVDQDRSGLPCIFIGAENQQRAYAFSHDGKTLAGWPAGTNFRFVQASLAIGDINLDGVKEIVGGDECCYVFSWQPVGDWKNTGSADSSFLWRNLTGTPSTAIYGSSCALGDVNADAQSMPDVVVGTNHEPEFYAFPGDVWGDYISNPLYINGWPRSGNGRCESSPAIGDIDGDGKNDVAIGSDDGNVYIGTSSNGSWIGCPTGAEVQASPALADLDGDGKLDVIVGSKSGKVFVFNWLGQSLPGWAGGITLNPSGSYPVESSPVVGDINGDGKLEIVIGCDDGNLYALYSDGTNHKENGALTGPIAWVKSCMSPGQGSVTITTAPVIDDIDGDGKVEVLVAASTGVYLFHLDAPYTADPALYPWPTFHHDNQRTGCVTPPCVPVKASIQGVVKIGGVGAVGVKVFIFNQDGSSVPIPYSIPAAPRSNVLTVGSTEMGAVGVGAYCISQLEPNAKYNLEFITPSGSIKWVNNVEVTTGSTRVDVNF